MARRRFVTNRKWVRGFDWDAATFGYNGAAGTTFYGVLRVASDAPDPTQNDLNMHPKTLVKMLIALQHQSAGVANNAQWQSFFGIIPIDAYQADDINGADVPDPSLGSYDWMAWITWGATNVAGSTQTYTTQFNANGGGGGMLEIKSQRKLPPGRALLWVGATVCTTAINFSLTGAVRLGLKGDVTAPGLGGG